MNSKADFPIGTRVRINEVFREGLKPTDPGNQYIGLTGTVIPSQSQLYVYVELDSDPLKGGEPTGEVPMPVKPTELEKI